MSKLTERLVNHVVCHYLLCQMNQNQNNNKKKNKTEKAKENSPVMHL